MARGEFFLGVEAWPPIAVDAADGLVDDAAALVHHQPGAHAPVLELVHQLLTAGAGPFLSAGGGQVHVLRRREALGQQAFGGLKEGHYRAFGVRCAAAPYLALGDIARKGRVLPDALGGHHVLVAHEHQGLIVLFAGPVEQQVAVDLGLFQPLVYQGEQPLQHLMEAQKCIPLVGLGNGNRIIAHHGRQLFGQGPGVLFIGGRGIGGALGRRAQRMDQRGQKRQQQKAQQRQCDPENDHAFASLRNFR